MKDYIFNIDICNEFEAKRMDLNYRRYIGRGKGHQYYVSDYLKAKFDQYEVKRIEPFLIWKLDDDKVCKMFLNKTCFNRSVKMQNILAAAGLGCKLLDTWVNDKPKEYFTISEYGGINLARKYPFSHPDRVESRLNEIREELKKLGYVQVDWHLGNFVEDNLGYIRIIDYDSIYPCDSAPDSFTPSPLFD